MTTQHDDVNICAGAGHHIGSLSIVRCRHDESYTVTAWFTIDNGDDDQTTYLNNSIKLGPFDRSYEVEAVVRRQLGYLLDLSMATLRQREPSHLE